MKHLRIQNSIMRLITAVFILIAILMFNNTIYTQTKDFLWVKQFDTAIVEDIITDEFGNFFVTGLFTNTTAFGSTILTSAGSKDIFITKYNMLGNVLWAKSLGGTSNDIGYGIAVDKLGNIAIIGYFNGIMFLDADTLTSFGSSDIFMAKYDAFGNLLWFKQAGGINQDEGRGIAFDASGNIVITGYFNGTAAFDNDTLISIGSTDIFIAKYDPSGNVLWTERAGEIQADKGYDISIDASDNIIITGYYSGEEMYLAKYNPSGNNIWEKMSNGTRSAFGNAIAIDKEGNSIVIGYFFWTVSFGQFTLTAIGEDFPDLFIVKYDNEGNVLWARRDGGRSGDIGEDVATDKANNIIVTGYFAEQSNFGTFTLTSIGYADMFLVMYNASGDALWAKQAGGVEGDQGRCISTDRLDNIFVSGLFRGTATFGKITLSSLGADDGFITKLGLNPPFNNPPLDFIAGDRFDGLVPLTWDPPSASTFVNNSKEPMAEEAYFNTGSKRQINKMSNDNNSISYYNIYRSSTSGGPYTLIASVDPGLHHYGNNEDYIDAEVTNGSTYYYVVTAVYPEGESDYSAEVSATPSAPGPTIISQWANSIPTINGLISPGEWSDATSIDITCPAVPLTVNAFIKNDGNHLYIAADDPNDTYMDDKNELVIYYDDDHNHTWDPDSLTGEGNYFLRVVETVFRGIYGDYPYNLGWTDTLHSPAGVVSGISNASGHLQYEACFDLTISQLNATPGGTIGFKFFVLDPERIYPYHYGYPGAWPYGYIWPAPLTFGDLKLSTQPDLWEITGNISYYFNSEPVNDIVVEAVGTSYVDITNENGDYGLLDLPSGHYIVRPEKENHIGNSISAFDAAWVLQYGVNLRTFTPYQMIAGDVSGNGSVSAFDAAKILQYGVGLINQFPVMPDSLHFWRFVPDNFALSMSNWMSAPDSIAYTRLNSNTSDNYKGIIYGDVSGNWHPTEKSLEKSPVAIAGMRLENVHGESGDNISLPLYLDNGTDIIAMSFTLAYNPQVLKAIRASLTSLTQDYQIAHKVEAGRIKVALAGSQPIVATGAIVNLEFEVLQSEIPETGSLLQITEILINEGSISANIQPAEFRMGVPLPEDYVLEQNYPNPFNPETMIKYQLPKSGKVVLKIYNTLGQEIKTLVNEEKEAGYHEVRWDSWDNNGVRVSSGVYIYRISVGDFVSSKKLIFMM